MPNQKKNMPWLPSQFEIADAAALKALEHGNAEPHQQQRALKFIVEQLCGTYDQTYYPDSARDSDFAQGKRTVGLEIVKLLTVNIGDLRRTTE